MVADVVDGESRKVTAAGKNLSVVDDIEAKPLFCPDSAVEPLAMSKYAAPALPSA